MGAPLMDNLDSWGDGTLLRRAEGGLNARPEGTGSERVQQVQRMAAEVPVWCRKVHLIAKQFTNQEMLHKCSY
jgi:hypothetical protein